LQKAGITAVEQLKDDSKVQLAADLLFAKTPFFQRQLINATLGRKGFYAIIFELRDKMLQVGSMDLSWLTADFIRDKVTIAVTHFKPGK